MSKIWTDGKVMLVVPCEKCEGKRGTRTCKNGIPIIRIGNSNHPCASDDICKDVCVHTCTCTDGYRPLTEREVDTWQHVHESGWESLVRYGATCGGSPVKVIPCQ